MFLQSVFIRKNTPELQEKLRELGYKTDYSTTTRGCIATSSVCNKFSIINSQDFDSSNPHITWNNDDRIDCGYNEELFLALAALRDDSDYMQLFTDGDKWFQNKQNDIEVIRYGAGNPINFHKATVEEIIKYFKYYNMDISKVKYFVHQDVLQDTMIYAKDFETIETIEDFDIGLYGIVETEEGDVLFEIDFKYDGEPFVWRKFMHLKSFLGFYKYRKAKYLDSHSEKFITSYV